MRKRKSSIQGVSFPWKRALGITGAKQSFAWQTGISSTQQGMKHQVGSALLGSLFSVLSGEKKI